MLAKGEEGPRYFFLSQAVQTQMLQAWLCPCSCLLLLGVSVPSFSDGCNPGAISLPGWQAHGSRVQRPEALAVHKQSYPRRTCKSWLRPSQP